MTSVILVSRRAPVVSPCPPPSASTFRTDRDRTAAHAVQQQDLLRLSEDVSESGRNPPGPVSRTTLKEPNCNLFLQIRPQRLNQINADYKQVLLNEPKRFPLQVLDWTGVHDH